LTRGGTAPALEDSLCERLSHKKVLYADLKEGRTFGYVASS